MQYRYKKVKKEDVYELIRSANLITAFLVRYLNKESGGEMWDSSEGNLQWALNNASYVKNKLEGFKNEK